jgi:hypothetical protein
VNGEAGARAGYLELLSAELLRVGIRGDLRRRILTEFADHLESDPDAELGLPSALARQFADELGTFRARVAAVRSFAALALAGALFAATILFTAALGGVGRANLSPPVTLVLLGCILAGQVSAVAGGLGLLRALRLRRQAVVPTREAVVLTRRAGIGLVSGALTMTALPLIVLAAPHVLSAAWREFALVAAGVGLVAICAAAPSVFAATRVRPLVAGPADGLCGDVGSLLPKPVAARPWRFAFLVACALAVVVTVAGVGANDPYDGALRGVIEAAACLVGFGLLGPYLGLR